MFTVASKAANNINEKDISTQIWDFIIYGIPFACVSAFCAFLAGYWAGNLFNNDVLAVVVGLVVFVSLGKFIKIFLRFFMRICQVAWMCLIAYFIYLGNPSFFDGYLKPINDAKTYIFGKEPCFYANDQKKSEGDLVDGERVGVWTWWFENGQKSHEGSYANCKYDGVWTYWHENGQKSVEGNYVDGDMQGNWAWWYKSGQKQIKGRYKNGKKEGNWTWWHENGQIDRWEHYE